MPIYEYRCRECDKAFELLVRTPGSAGVPARNSEAGGAGEPRLGREADSGGGRAPGRAPSDGPRCPACDSDDLKRLFSLFASPSERPAMAMSGGGGCCGGGCGCH
jgi:hypothetical protein